MEKRPKQPKASAARQAVSKASGKKTKHKKGSGAVIVAVVLTLALVVFVGLYAYGSQLESSKVIFPNVRIAGIDVGGLTVIAAQGEVEQSIADAYYSQPVEVQLPDRTLTFDPEQTKVAVDAEAAVREALAYGRSDGPFLAVFNYLTSAGKPHDVELETALELDTGYISDLLAITAREVKRDPVNGTVTFEEESGTLTVTKGVPGQVLDTDALYEVVHSAFQRGDFTPLTWEYTPVPCLEADLAAAHRSVTSEMEETHYDAETHTIVEGVSGWQFDLQAQQKKLDAAAYGEKLTIQLEEIKPEKTAEELNAEMFGEKLDSRSSYYVNNANRTENLRLACAAINGTIVNPGEVFSFNDTVGERTAEKGYKPATIYGGDGESVDGVGGGICQVASTIYYSSLYMNLETVMREPHMYTVDYVPRGMDATVYWDSGLDYKFRNNRENPIKIQANVDGGMVNITFWGVKEDDSYVVMDYKVLETWTDEDVEEVDETKDPGYRELKQTAYAGAKVEAYQKVYDGSGNLITERTIKSTYKSRPRLYIVGPTIEEEPPEEELPEEELPEEEMPGEELPEEDFWGDLENPWGDTEGEEYWP